MKRGKASFYGNSTSIPPSEKLPPPNFLRQRSRPAETHEKAKIPFAFHPRSTEPSPPRSLLKTPPWWRKVTRKLTRQTVSRGPCHDTNQIENDETVCPMRIDLKIAASSALLGPTLRAQASLLPFPLEIVMHVDTPSHQEFTRASPSTFQILTYPSSGKNHSPIDQDHIASHFCNLRLRNLDLELLSSSSRSSPEFGLPCTISRVLRNVLSTISKHPQRFRIKFYPRLTACFRLFFYRQVYFSPGSTSTHIQPGLIVSDSRMINPVSPALWLLS
jgi:hypothetical protein